MTTKDNPEHEERGITSACRHCGQRVPKSELRGGLCPPCAKLMRS